MGLIKKSITLTEQQDQWVKSQVEAGHYGNESEVLRDLIRREQKRSTELEATRLALVEGERSGISSESAREVASAAVAALRKDDHS